jgi:hypothetical protein
LLLLRIWGNQPKPWRPRVLYLYRYRMQRYSTILLCTKIHNKKWAPYTYYVVCT